MILNTRLVKQCLAVRLLSRTRAPQCKYASFSIKAPRFFSTTHAQQAPISEVAADAESVDNPTEQDETSSEGPEDLIEPQINSQAQSIDNLSHGQERQDSPSPPSLPEAKMPLWTDYADRLSPIILTTMRDFFRYKSVTNVQKTILDMMPVRHDLLVRSKTGTGKTLAFLVPALQRTIDEHDALGLKGPTLKKHSNENASVFIISPTRELANQIATEARRLVTIPGSNQKALCCVGGEPKKESLILLCRERNDFVVGTPGRLLDLLENHKDFSDRMRNIHTLILDEADTLLEMGFRKELERIIDFLPRDRQTFMFSATVSRDIQRIARQYLKPNHKFINTVSADDQDSHAKIKQEYIVRPASEHIHVVLSLLINQQLMNPNVKIMIFLPTTKMTMLYATIFKTLRRLYPNPAFQQFDIHAQRTQESRAKVAMAFRSAKAGSVLFTTDVSARGVDYPGVSLVIQVSPPNTRDLYIHRIGRTGRAGAEGAGIMILQSFETPFLKTLGKDIPIKEKYFPDSEIALGVAQQRCFDLMYRLAPPYVVEDAYSSLVAATIPRASEYGGSKPAMLETLNAWWSRFAGDHKPPAVSAHMMIPPRKRDFGRAVFTGRKSQVSFLSPETEWRPHRPSERLSNGRKRKDFSVPALTQSMSRRPYR